MAYTNKQSKVGDIKTMKVELTTIGGNVIEVGDKVEITGIGERGYDILEIKTKIRLLECGWDIFE